MKIAIHHRKGSFSDQWIKYCETNGIDYKIVNAFDNNIIKQLNDCDAFMWHHHHASFKDVLLAKKILFSLEHAGIKVFPDFKTGWHFDDKVAQKYLLEAIGMPLVPSYVFYDKNEALEWAEKTSYPKVFKLKGGAGASNVKLVNSYKDAKLLINKAFSIGFSQFDKIGNLKESFRNFKFSKANIYSFLKAIIRLIIIPKFAKAQPNEKGYIYFQKFIPNNKTDYRIKIVGGKCWGFQRKVRENDFRASGSGNLIFDISQIPLKMVELAFEISNKLELSSVAFDFILDESGNPLVVEMSYGFGIDHSEFDFGYWDASLNWYAGKFNPFGFMVNDIIKKLS